MVGLGNGCLPLTEVVSQKQAFLCFCAAEQSAVLPGLCIIVIKTGG